MESVDRLDSDLIEACREGKLSAWENILDRYERLVHSVPLRCGLSSEDAADIAQLTFSILLQNLYTLRPDSNLKAWLCTVARRQSWRMLRNRQHETLVAVDKEFAQSGATLLASSGRDVAPDTIEHWELVNWLQQGLAQLNDRCAKLIHALYFDDKQPTYADIAAQFHIPVGAIGPTRARCLERLKALLTA
jgi:RNA polymerase sigma factor (sigma-70 family)